MSSINISTVISRLVSEGNIPITGAFEVTENLIKDYFVMYGIVNKKVTGTGTNSNTKFARRLAGLNLLKENLARGVKASEILAGHIYLISNKAFPLHYKIGVSYDCAKRLAQYQTYSPYRDFILEKYDFVIDKFKTEKMLLVHPLIIKENGEWVVRENAKTVFDDLSRYNISDSSVY